MRTLGALAGNVRVAWVVLLATVAAIAVVLALPTPEPAEARSSSGLSEAYESVQVEQLQQDLASAQVQTAVVVLSRVDGGVLGEADLAAVSEAAIPAGGTAAAGQPPIPPQTSPDGTVALVLVPLPADLEQQETTDFVSDLRAGLAELPAGLEAAVTGEPAFLADISRVFEGADVDILLVTALVVAVILAVTYRSPLLVVVPLLVVGAAEQVVIKLLSMFLPPLGLVDNGSTAGIVSILVFGAATNYALLLIARYREQLRVTERPRDAMRVAVQRAGGAILASGGTVVLAVLALLLSVTQNTQALGAGAALGVSVAMVAGLIVLPCALVVFGRAVFWPFVPRLGSTGREGRLWARLGRATSRRPGLVAGVGVVVLLCLAAPVTGIQIGLSQNEQFRETPEAVAGAQTVAEAFSAGALSPAVIITAPGSEAAVAAQAETVGAVVEVSVGEGTAQFVQLDAVLDTEPRSEEAYQAVRDLRAAVATVPGADALVGGQVAADLDLSDAEARDRALIIPIILAAVLLVLVVLLRALVAPVLLLAAVVLTFFASLGASWVVFRTVFDYPAVDTPVLLISFVFLVALGVDYSIFLTTRAREEAAVQGTPEGMLTALRVTGGVITSAGVLLAAVFTVLGVLPLVLLTQIGVIVAVGVLLDTLVVRTLVVPALAFRLGGVFWWPARVDPPVQASRSQTAVSAGMPPSSSSGPEASRTSAPSGTRS